MAAYTTIDNPELYFQAKTYTGNGSAGHAITLDGSEDMQPDLVWIKQRDSRDHFLFNSVVGATKYLASNLNQTEQTDANTMTGFNSNGFTLGNGVGCNENTDTHVAWCWKESATAGFDIVLYSGNGTAGNTFSHSLSAVPHLIFCKIRNAEVADWYTYNASLGNTKNIYLNTTGAVSTSTLWWNATTPTSSVVTLGDQTGNNGNARNFVAYLFAPKQGYSAMGSYTGNGDASDGAFIYLGFKPAFFLCKNYQDSGDNWILHDNKRNTFNVTDEGLAPNDSGSEFTDVDMDFLSNGVKMRNNTGRANAAKTFIYIAFAESPFVNSNGVPNNAR